MRVPPHLLAGLVAGAATLASARQAHGWYFPEHMVIAHDGIMQLPPELRDVLKDAVSRAHGEGLALCTAVDVPIEGIASKQPLETRMLHSDLSTGCVPYSALPALAGDHASSVAELRAVLTTQKGVEITSAAAYEWSRFQAALGRLPNSSLERMSFVHSLDVAFYFIDPGYELRAQATQAHFADAGRPLPEVVRLVATGRVDTALGQFLAHHLRSLQLAAKGSSTDAILEHAFALHFLQDAFAAGHLVMTEQTWKSGNAKARRRHDFFNAKGLAVGRAMAVEPCPGLVDAGSLELTGLTPCWVTSGDGYLGTSRDASDRMHAARAVTKAQLELALALDPRRTLALVEALGEREQVALGHLIEPSPWWTVPATERRQLQASASRTLRLVRAAARAIERLRSGEALPAVEVGTPARPDLFEPAVLEDALAPCKAREQLEPAFVDAADVAPCGPSRALDLGAVGVSLLRPLLVVWPASQVDPSTLEGQSKEDLGWAAQLLTAASAGALFPPHAPVDFFAPAIGVAAGISYRWGTYLPGRLNRPPWPSSTSASPRRSRWTATAAPEAIRTSRCSIRSSGGRCSGSFSPRTRSRSTSRRATRPASCSSSAARASTSS